MTGGVREARPAATVELLYEGEVVRVQADDVLVGRTANCTVRVVHPLVSREHCRLEPRADGLFVVDLNAVNGTWLNGARVEGRAQARAGDRLGLGRDGAVLVVQRALVDGVDVSLAAREEDQRTMVAGDPRAAGVVARVDVSPAARLAARDAPTREADIPVVAAMPTAEITDDAPPTYTGPNPTRSVSLLGLLVGVALGLATVAVLAKWTPVFDKIRGRSAEVRAR